MLQGLCLPRRDRHQFLRLLESLKQFCLITGVKLRRIICDMALRMMTENIDCRDHNFVKAVRILNHSWVPVLRDIAPLKCGRKTLDTLLERMFTQNDDRLDFSGEITEAVIAMIVVYSEHRCLVHDWLLENQHELAVKHNEAKILRLAFATFSMNISEFSILEALGAINKILKTKWTVNELLVKVLNICQTTDWSMIMWVAQCFKKDHFSVTFLKGLICSKEWIRFCRHVIIFNSEDIYTTCKLFIHIYRSFYTFRQAAENGLICVQDFHDPAVYNNFKAVDCLFGICSTDDDEQYIEYLKQAIRKKAIPCSIETRFCSFIYASMVVENHRESLVPKENESYESMLLESRPDLEYRRIPLSVRQRLWPKP